MDRLYANLLHLLRELDAQGVPLTVAGGFGLYLKRMHLGTRDEQTLFVELPDVRSTNDIDLTRPAQRRAVTACRLVALSPGYLVCTAKRVK
jgi:hypothetical protein